MRRLFTRSIRPKAALVVVGVLAILCFTFLVLSHPHEKNVASKSKRAPLHVAISLQDVQDDPTAKILERLQAAAELQRSLDAENPNGKDHAEYVSHLEPDEIPDGVDQHVDRPQDIVMDPLALNKEPFAKEEEESHDGQNTLPDDETPAQSLQHLDVGSSPGGARNHELDPSQNDGDASAPFLPAPPVNDETNPNANSDANDASAEHDAASGYAKPASARLHPPVGDSRAHFEVISTAWTPTTKFDANLVAGISLVEDKLPIVNSNIEEAGVALVIECNECTLGRLDAIASEFCRKPSWLQRLHVLWTSEDELDAATHANCVNFGITEVYRRRQASPSALFLEAKSFRETHVLVARLEPDSPFSLTHAMDMYQHAMSIDPAPSVIGSFPFSVRRKFLKAHSFDCTPPSNGADYFYNRDSYLLLCGHVKNSYNMITGDVLMVRRAHIQEYFSAKYKSARKYVTMENDCEDILLNLVVAASLLPQRTSTPPSASSLVQLVSPTALFYDAGSGRPSLTAYHHYSQPGVMRRRRECVDKFFSLGFRALPSAHTAAVVRVPVPASSHDDKPTSKLVRMDCTPPETHASSTDSPSLARPLLLDSDYTPEEFPMERDRAWAAHEENLALQQSRWPSLRILVFASSQLIEESDLLGSRFSYIHHFAHLLATHGPGYYVSVVIDACLSQADILRWNHFVSDSHLHLYSKCDIGDEDDPVDTLYRNALGKTSASRFVFMGSVLIDSLLGSGISFDPAKTWLVSELWDLQDGSQVLTEAQYARLQRTEAPIFFASPYLLPPWISKLHAVVSVTAKDSVNMDKSFTDVRFVPPLLIPQTFANARLAPTSFNVCEVSETPLSMSHRLLLADAIEEMLVLESRVRVIVKRVRDPLSTAPPLAINTTEEFRGLSNEWALVHEHGPSPHEDVGFFSEKCDIAIMFEAPSANITARLLTIASTGLPLLLPNSFAHDTLYAIIKHADRPYVFFDAMRGHGDGTVDTSGNALSGLLERLLFPPATHYERASAVWADVAAPFFTPHVRQLLLPLLDLLYEEQLPLADDEVSEHPEAEDGDGDGDTAEADDVAHLVPLKLVHSGSASATIVDSVSDLQINTLRQYRLHMANQGHLVNYEAIPSPKCNIKIAAIMDTFTYTCFRPEANVIRLLPDTWVQQLEESTPDLVFVESVWEQPWAAAFKPFSKRMPEREIMRQYVRRLLSWARENNVPSVFWNKEDPPNFGYFAHHEVPMMVNHIFTTERRCLERYREVVHHNRIHALSFGAQPFIHNPINSARPRLGFYAFAGTYAYRVKYPHRGPDLDKMLMPSLSRGLTVFDRNNRAGVPYPIKSFKMFPERVRLEGIIREALPYELMRREYKKYNVFLSVNSVRDSRTMFSRRVLEISASGTPVMSNPSPSLTYFLGRYGISVVHESDDAERAVRLFDSHRARERMTLTAQRHIFANHTYQVRLDTILDKMGFSHLCPRPDNVVSVVTCLPVPVHQRCDNFTLLHSTLVSFGDQNYQQKELVVVLASEYLDEEEGQEFGDDDDEEEEEEEEEADGGKGDGKGTKKQKGKKRKTKKKGEKSVKGNKAKVKRRTRRRVESDQCDAAAADRWWREAQHHAHSVRGAEKASKLRVRFVDGPSQAGSPGGVCLEAAAATPTSSDDVVTPLETVKVAREYSAGGSLRMIIAFFLAHDVYGPEYLVDMVNALAFSSAELVGKSAFFLAARANAHFPELVQPDFELEYVSRLPANGAIVMRRALLSAVPLTPDLTLDAWLDRCLDNSVVTFSSNRWNYAHIHPLIDRNRIVASLSGPDTIFL